MKTILGLDLGTNSIGWALIKQNFETKQGRILGIGSRIIPMTQDVMDNFGSGTPSKTQTSARTDYRSVRRLRERNLLRRERLHRLLNILDFLPDHYSNKIDFENRLGKFLPGTEPKLVYDDNHQFIFKNSFEEMLKEFQREHPELLSSSKKIPYDWTIYYLRKKALSQKIQKEELAWIILNFNQKRGYYQLRGEEEEENPNKLVEFFSLEIVDVIADEQRKGTDKIWYSIILENGWIYRRESKYPLFDWKNKVRDFIVTTDLNEDGSIKTDKEGKEKRSFRAPNEDDWTLLKKKTENEIDNSQKTVGEYIYDALLDNPSQKIKGKLVRTIERKFYKEEITKILKKQTEFHAELKERNLLNSCVDELYPRNEERQKLLKTKDFVYLFIEDILFYQRPLKSQKHNIGDCKLEYREYAKNGVKIKDHLKTISRSHPLFQEFRIWQWIQNLKIYDKLSDEEVTFNFLSSIDDYDQLFDFLWNRKEVDHKALLEYLIKRKYEDLKPKQISTKAKEYRWNYVYDSEKDESKFYPMGETNAMIKNRLEKIEQLPGEFLTSEILEKLWHIIYSVTDKIEYEKALNTFAKKNDIDAEQFVENFKKFPPFKSDYSSYSLKAIKKLLPLMRMGKYWKEENIDAETQRRLTSIKERIESINYEEKKLQEISDDDILKPVLKSFMKFKNRSFNQGLNTYQASYAVYNKHSEGDATKWNSVEDLEKYLDEFKQHSLRNPIVEQLVTETLRVVRDIWKDYGNGDKDFFNEIHIELGRDLRNSADERKRISANHTKNENTNLRIKLLLTELLNEGVENVRPFSPMQQEILKIYEEGALSSETEIPDEILKISVTAQPTTSQLQRYKLWLEQKYKSPYTGQMIPLSKLFTTEYEIEHIIPQSRFFDDGFSNKVICESAVNKRKDNQLGLEFIKNCGGEIVELDFGKKVPILNENDYRDFIDLHYSKNRAKKAKLLLEEVPEKMIERQLNDTRYISKLVMQLLSNIVRSEDGKDDGVNSKNVLPVTGKITSELKNDWGLNDIWNDLILPRFIRLNEMTNSNDFTTYNEKYQKVLPTVPLHLEKGFQKKRIDHRHHSLDALVIACTTRNHINYLNNQSALDDSYKKKFYTQEEYREKFQKAREDLRRDLCDKNFNSDNPKNYKWTFKKPWQNFTKDAKDRLETTIISFKQNQRIINKTVNYYQKYNDEGKKVFVKQTKGDNWAIRKSLHKETVSAKVDLPRIKVPRGKILTATRKLIDISFTLKTIESITDTGIQKILKNYLEYKEYNSELAFSPEGIEEMNQNIEKYNDGVAHKPIFKVRIFETGSKFPLGETGNKTEKYVEAAKGTNLFFGIYIDEEGKRVFDTIAFNIVVERLKQGLSAVPETNEKGNDLLYSLSPQDLVYVPTEEERVNTALVNFEDLTKEQISRIYKMVSSSGTQCFFVKSEVASSIANKFEFTSLNKMENTIDGKQVKSICWKLETTRLGRIIKVIR
ncbi:MULTISPECIES: type II CRISPR RNA-guided endonuclease Cas9 [Chryseobacterium]|uniref:type II CRISPR RNA-guided endonuclease Cas9 n=1 Tax=Chryseobacterium sp. R2A-55 TaxID=2744445 RepID=UPI001F2500C0|nr:type II CRISPR RNA-guided endonuclease Cas9 [Chryseobacterium sp. R2A-55]